MKVFDTDIEFARKLARITKGYAFAFQGLSEQDRKVILAISSSKTKVTDICQDLQKLRVSTRNSKFRILDC